MSILSLSGIPVSVVGLPDLNSVSAHKEGIVWVASETEQLMENCCRASRGGTAYQHRRVNTGGLGQAEVGVRMADGC